MTSYDSSRPINIIIEAFLKAHRTQSTPIVIHDHVPSTVTIRSRWIVKIFVVQGPADVEVSKLLFFTQPMRNPAIHLFHFTFKCRHTVERPTSSFSSMSCSLCFGSDTSSRRTPLSMSDGRPAHEAPSKFSSLFANLEYQQTAADLQM